MLTTNDKGSQTEGAVLAALLRSGYSVLIPFGVSRYDLVVDGPHGFKRIQCKTARLMNGGASMMFNVASNPPGGKARTYDGEVDYFGVYLPPLDHVYLIPVEAVSGVTRSAMLRLKPAANGQTSKVRLADQYRLVAQMDRASAS